MIALTGPKAFWAHWGLLRRITSVQGVLLLCAAIVLTGVLTYQNRGEAVLEQQSNARLLLLIVSPLVAEQAVVGDYAAIKQMLERQATSYRNTSSLLWKRNGQEEVSARVNPPASESPAWFARMMAMPAIRHSVPISLGGIDYGTLEVTLEPTLSENQLWQRFAYYVWLSLSAAVTVLLALFLVLRGNLRVLRHLAQAADRFSHGELEIRIETEGAREVHDAAAAFNNMTDHIRQLLTDLSDSRQQFREQLHFTEELIEALPVPMYSKNPKGIYTSANKAWETYFGLSRTEMIGRKVRDLYPQSPDTASLHEKMDEALWRDGGVQVYEVPIQNRDGQERQAMYSKSTLTDADGQVTGMIGIITDLTELKGAMRKAREALDGKTSAEEASQAKSLFLANMSHEIRTPLTAIIGFSEALLDVKQSMPERIEGIRTINRAGKHLLTIINDILDLSKIEAGRLEVERLPVPLFDLLDEVASLARLQAESKGIYFHVEPVFPLPETPHIDPVRVKQILFNLIGNAIKFTDQGGVTLRVRHDAANKLVLEVSDTGIGITREQLARLFQPFTQADASTTRRFGGTGLGLALSRQLAEMLGGGIGVESSPGQGSRFTLSLDSGPAGPFIDNAEQATRLQQSAQVPKDLPALSGSILLAEDNPDNQRLIGLNTRRLGAEITLVENGELAVAAALARPYDLILMDMQMPVMDGIAATRALRAHGYRGPIVALTANATQQDMQNCLEAGCDGFLSKPIERNRFNETLRGYLHSSREAAEETEREPVMPPLLWRDPGLAQLMTHFLGRVIDSRRVLLNALEAGDSETIRRLARGMKSLGADYMCPRITEVAGQLEFAATAGDGRAVRELVAKLSGLVDRIELTPPAEAPGQTTGNDLAPLVSELLRERPDMADLVDYFVGRLPGYEQGLKDALASGDQEALKKQAHDLKSVGGGYGYPQMTELAIKMEDSLAGGGQEEMATLIEAFSRLARRIEAGAAEPGGDERPRARPTEFAPEQSTSRHPAVLLVDDEEANRMILAQRLEQDGYRVASAESGARALEIMRAQRIQLVLLDRHMPEMDGLATLDAIKADAALSAIPVVMLSAESGRDTVDKCLARGAVDYLAKPVAPETLQQCLRHWLGEVAASATPTTPGSALAREDAIIDWPALSLQFNDRRDFILKIMNTVLAAHGETPARLREAAAQGELEQLAFLAHTLKGVGGNIKAARLHELAARAETSARGGRADAAELAGQLAFAMEALLAAIAARSGADEFKREKRDSET
ncbi:MAG: hypothetical protein B7Y41_03560 [Hydrogenophilales bacterium 28-61-23]|nr:MAG: hypothetical protein B7Y41_03560 [Hydrogenophilales bacterium 28-61-23]